MNNYIEKAEIPTLHGAEIISLDKTILSARKNIEEDDFVEELNPCGCSYGCMDCLGMSWGDFI
jgi:hypothetical protein